MEPKPRKLWVNSVNSPILMKSQYEIFDINPYPAALPSWIARVSVSLTHVRSMYYINQVLVRDGYRGKGYGSQVMKLVTEAADSKGVDLRLIARPFSIDPRLDADNLFAFYERKGFIRQDAGRMFRPHQNPRLPTNLYNSDDEANLLQAALRDTI